MATNPKLPDFPDIPPKPRPEDNAKVHLIRQSKFPWPLLALIAGAAMLIAIIAVLPRGPHQTRTPAAAQVPLQPTANQIQLTNERIDAAPVGDAIYLDALLRNTGNSAVTGVQIEGLFTGKNGQALQTEKAAVQGVSQDGTAAQDLTQAPIKPNQERPVRIYFAHMPKEWNHQIPQLTVTTVTGTTP